MILKTCRLYNVFGSGANHGIYAQFMSQSALANGGRKVGLLRGAGTRMALWFYAMIRVLRLRQPLTATIHQQKFVDLNLNESAKAVIFLARKQIRKYAEDGCEGFFCSRLFFCVSVLSDFGFVEQ